MIVISIRDFFPFVVVTNEYECLSQMNMAALDKYNQIHRKFQHVNHSMRTLNDANGNENLDFVFRLKLDRIVDYFSYEIIIDIITIE